MNKCYPSIRSVLLPIHPLDSPARRIRPDQRSSRASDPIPTFASRCSSNQTVSARGEDQAVMVRANQADPQRPSPAIVIFG